LWATTIGASHRTLALFLSFCQKLLILFKFVYCSTACHKLQIILIIELRHGFFPLTSLASEREQFNFISAIILEQENFLNVDWKNFEHNLHRFWCSFGGMVMEH
jgi:hypothetical protein